VSELQACGNVLTDMCISTATNARTAHEPFLHVPRFVQIPPVPMFLVACYPVVEVAHSFFDHVLRSIVAPVSPRKRRQARKYVAHTTTILRTLYERWRPCHEDDITSARSMQASDERWSNVSRRFVPTTLRQRRGAPVGTQQFEVVDERHERYGQMNARPFATPASF
jgi:hypothetical protein